MRLSDLRVYGKFLSRNKLYTLVTVLGFAVSLMFVLLLSIYVKQELSVDQFHEKKDRIYLLAQDKKTATFANPIANLVKDNIPEVESFVRVMRQTVKVDVSGEKQNIQALLADSTFFTIFSFPLIEGSASNVLAEGNSAVITPSLARMLFKDENPIGKSITLTETEPTVEVIITGIMEELPQNTQILPSDLIINYSLLRNYNNGTDENGLDILTGYWNCGFTIYCLAKEGTDLPAKAPEVLKLFHNHNYWHYTEGFVDSVTFIPLTEVYFSSGLQTGYRAIKTNSKSLIFIYLAITLLILGVAILNYINLSMAQAGKRGKEAALRKLLGCSKRELLAQFIVESMIMTVISFVAGLFLAFVAEPFFNNSLNTKLHLGHELLAPSFMLMLLGLILFTGIVSGLVPAFTVSRFLPIEVVKGAFSKKVKTIYSKVLISFQYVVAITLVICCFFIVKQTDFMKTYDLGFDKDNILIIEESVSPQQIPALRSQLEAIAGVERVSFPAGSPLSGSNNNSFERDGQAYSFQVFMADSAFFDIFNIKITPTNITPSGETVWLNEKGYNAMRPDSVTQDFEYWYGQHYQVAGITSNFHINSLHSDLDMVLIQMRPEGWGAWSIVVKINATANPIEVGNQVKKAYLEFNGGQPFELLFSDSIVQKWYEKEEKTSSIMTAFSILTIVIMIMGVFAMSMYMIRQKRKEISLRKVNGASIGQVLLMLNVESLKRVLIAFVVACPIAYYASNKWLESYSYRISLDWWVFAQAGGIVLFLTLLSVSWMTWRAARANPIDYLRAE